MSEFKSVLQPAAVRCPPPLPWPAAHKCEFTLNIGLFFDGTDNNQTVYTDKNTNTNVVRLSEAYRDDPENGYFRYYVSGVGTPFSELERKEAEAFGGPAGAGGEARILYGLLQVVSSIHSIATASAMGRPSATPIARSLRKWSGWYLRTAPPNATTPNTCSACCARR